MLRHLLFLSLFGLWTLLSLWSNANAEDVPHKPVTEDCLECLCETTSGCDAKAICVNGACGIFRITLGFWKEGGQLTLSNETTLTQTAFTDCVNDPHCAADTIQNYMYKYGQDCNRDGKIDCLDFGALHKMGNLACQKDMPYFFAKQFNECLKKKEKAAASRIVTK